MGKFALVRWFLRVSTLFYLLKSLDCLSRPPNSLKYHSSSPLNEISEDFSDYASQKDMVLEKTYHGLIRENETLVEITPILKVDEEKICDFQILKKQFHDIPFKINLINNLGVIKATHPLNCENRKSYHFELVAIYCDGTHSAPANVHIAVIDINEYAPMFSQQSYVIEVDEGRLYKEIIKVQANDKDCTSLFGDICKYSILNDDQPFIIDNDGSIKNTEPLSHKISHNHILSVVAFDCAMKESEPIMVNIKVRRVCEPKYHGVPERIDYSSASNESLFLFPKLHLELCERQCSHDDKLYVKILLKTKHISFGCDSDRVNCSPRKDLLDLLPRGADWTQYIKTDEGSDPIFHFDGDSGIVIPDNILASYDFSKRSFSILTIFRHSEAIEKSKHIKEHIICSADDHKMNRHHMALFVRNCRLIFLLRKNFKEGDLNIFSPAEWRWKIPQVCDNDWHHYVLNVELSGKVELFIDGKRFKNNFEDKHSNPEVIDDWPLHAAHGVNTTLTVGACFQSSENRLKHTFSGDISEVKILLNSNLDDDAVKCDTSCAEYLKLDLPNSAGSDSQLQINTQMNEIYIESSKKDYIENVLQNIQYLNTKKHPTVGRRNIEIQTKFTCKNRSILKIPTVETYIMVTEPNQAVTSEKKISHFEAVKNSPSPAMMYEKVKHKEEKPQKADTMKIDLSKKNIIKIIGNSNKLVSYAEIKRGVHILKGINISISNEEKSMSNIQYLDACSVVIFPSLNPDHEEINIEENSNLSSSIDIKTTIDKDGFEIIGKDDLANYIHLLQSLIYSNKKPAYYLNRVFKLSCSQLTSQSECTELTLVLTVLHPKQSTLPLTTVSSIEISEAAPYYKDEFISDPSEQYENKLYAHALLHRNEAQEPKSHFRSSHKVENSNPSMLIGLLCGFVVVALIAVSIIKMKNNNSSKFTETQQQCQRSNDEGLLWDDSALTITINPMQMESDESSESENSESEEDDCIKGKFPNLNQLEWDNSNIFTTRNK